MRGTGPTIYVDRNLLGLNHCSGFPAVPVLQHLEMQEGLAFLFRLLRKLKLNFIHLLLLCMKFEVSIMVLMFASVLQDGRLMNLLPVLPGVNPWVDQGNCKVKQSSPYRQVNESHCHSFNYMKGELHSFSTSLVNKVLSYSPGKAPVFSINCDKFKLIKKPGK